MGSTLVSGHRASLGSPCNPARQATVQLSPGSRPSKNTGHGSDGMTNSDFALLSQGIGTFENFQDQQKNCLGLGTKHWAFEEIHLHLDEPRFQWSRTAQHSQPPTSREHMAPAPSSLEQSTSYPCQAVNLSWGSRSKKELLLLY